MKRALALLTLMLAVLVPQPAIAEEPAPAPDPGYFTAEAVVENLDSKGQVVSTATYDGTTAGGDTIGQLDSKGGFVTMSSGSEGSVSSSGCRKVTVNNYHHNLLGSVAYIYKTWTSYCWTRSTYKVTNLSHGWSLASVGSQQYWRGEVNKELRYYSFVDGKPYSGYYHYRQGQFDNCILKYGCIATTYPTNIIRAHSNGTWTWRADGAS